VTPRNLAVTWLALKFTSKSTRGSFHLLDGPRKPPEVESAD